MFFIKGYVLCMHTFSDIYMHFSEMPAMQPHHVLPCSVTVTALEGEVEIRHTTDSWGFKMAEKPQTVRISEIP